MHVVRSAYQFMRHDIRRSNEHPASDPSIDQRLGQVARLLTVAAVGLTTFTLAGCGSGGGCGSGSVNDFGGSVASAVPRFAYVTNTNENLISFYAVNSTSGQLRSFGYVMAGFQPFSITIDSSRRFAYVANQSGSLSTFAINATTGSLTEVPGSPIAAGPLPTSVIVDPSGRFAYVANVWPLTFLFQIAS